MLQESYHKGNYLFMQLKKSQKPDIKTLIEQLEEKVLHSGEEIFNADEVKRRNLERINKKQGRRKAEGGATGRRGRKKRGMEEEDE